MYSIYFLAKVEKKKAWLLSGSLHYFGHIAIERGVYGCSDTFEFFVPKDMVNDFLLIMQDLVLKKVVLDFSEEKNRLKP